MGGGAIEGDAEVEAAAPLISVSSAIVGDRLRNASSHALLEALDRA
jgi:hypothetical protein